MNVSEPAIAPDDDSRAGLGSLLHGKPSATALSVGGAEISYADFASRATRAAAKLDEASDGIPGLVVVRTPDLLTALIQIYAAFVAGHSVLVTDPELPVPEINDLPPGTDLLTTTSGSTGHPRVIARTVASWLASMVPFTELTQLTTADTVAITGPLHGSLHLFGAVHTLWLGATLTDSVERATAVHCVPSTLDALVRDGIQIKQAIVGGAAMTSGLADRARGLGMEIVEYYGAAELSFVAARRYRRPLVPFPGVEVEVRDGVIWARSPYLALGYAGTAGALRVDEDGFASVGDLGAFSGNSLTIRGRSDAAITTGGSTVLAEDIEAVLATAPGIRAVAVVGVPHERLGEIVVAVVELAANAVGQHIRAYARGELQSAALPRRWFIAELPRSSGGKIARSIVRSRLLDGTLEYSELA
jgi:long-chain acyl-CoA synthetase